MTSASQKRIDRFVDWFIRSEFMENLESERDSDFINEPDRAERCYDAAEDGCDGKTHSEVIDDWRDGFDLWLNQEHRGYRSHLVTLFYDGVTAHFDAVEKWHDEHGSLFQQIG